MSDPIVLELQRLASDNSHDLGDLLRKSLMVAKKLKIDDFKKWISNELNGYEKRDEVPKYRWIQTQLKAVNRWRGGLDPMMIADPEMDELFCHTPMMQSIAELDSLSKREDGMFHTTILPEEQKLIWRLFQMNEPVEVIREGSRLSIVGIVDAVRNMILDWALELEEQGILGHGMTFTPEEKAIAMTSQNIHIGSFQGVLGNVSESNVTQNQQMTINAGDFESLQKQLAAAGIDKEDLDTLKQALASDPEPESKNNFGPKVSSWIGDMLGKAASGAWKVTLETANKLIPAAIASYYGLKG